MRAENDTTVSTTGVTGSDACGGEAMLAAETVGARSSVEREATRDAALSRVATATGAGEPTVSESIATASLGLEFAPI
jgi:hypothetical protein